MMLDGDAIEFLLLLPHQECVRSGVYEILTTYYKMPEIKS